MAATNHKVEIVFCDINNKFTKACVELCKLNMHLNAYFIYFTNLNSNKYDNPYLFFVMISQ